MRQDPAYTYSNELIYNLGLNEWFLEQFGPAMAHFRLAQYIHPYSWKNFQTLSWATQELEDKYNLSLRQDPIFMRLSLWLPPKLLYGFSLCFLFIAGFLAMRTKALPWRARITKAAPGLSLSFIVFCLFVFVQSQHQRVFATMILAEPSLAFSAPSDEAADIGYIYPGESVEVLKTTENWWQIHASGIPSGWVNAAALQIHNRLD